MKANSPIILEISSILHSIKSSPNSQSIHILNDNNLLPKTLIIQVKKYPRNQSFRFSEQDFIADSIEQGRVAGAPDAGTRLTESIGFENFLKSKNKLTKNETNQLPILFGEKNDKQDNGLPSITISLSTLKIKNLEEIISRRGIIRPTPNTQGIEQEISLDQYFLESNIKQTSKNSSLISPSAVPTYNNALASTGEVLPYGVKAVWGGLDISRQGNSGANSHVFVIDSGVLDTTNDLNLNTEWSKSWISGESAFTDGAGHGTHVAGTIAALANGRGVVGVAPGSKVTSLKVFDSNGGGASYSTIIDAVIYATQIINDNELDKTKVVINMSLGGMYNKSLDAAIRNAADQGIVFAIAAGNNGHDADLYSPASAGDHQNVYTISAVDNQYQMPSWSNWDDQINGDDVSYAAPGVNIFSYYKGGQLAYLSGTSMAAPHVAGLLLMGGVKEGDMVLANSSGESDPFALIKSSHAINYITISTVGSVALQRDSGTGLYAVTEEGGKAIPITIDNTQIYEGIYVGWQAVAAATINNINTIAWKHISGNISIWNADDNWSYLDTPFSGYLKGLEALQWEAAFNQDFNGDNAISLSFSDAPISSNGGINLGLIAQEGFGYGIRVGAGAIKPISFAGRFAEPDNSGGGWVGIAATPDADGSDGYDFYWQNINTEQYSQWNLDNTGALSSYSLLSKAQFLAQETRLQSDLDQDGVTGLTFTPSFTIADGLAISEAGSFGSTELGYAISDGAGGSIQITNGGNPVSESGAWSAHASVMSPDGGYKVFWENSQTGLRTSWNLDESGDLTSWGFITDADLFQAEDTYDADLDGDGLQGLVFSAFSASNSLGMNQLGYAIADGAGGSIQITNGGNPVSESGAWSAHASVMSPDGGYKVFWENSQTGLRTSWNLDESGDLTSWGFITDADLFQAEDTYDADLDGDGLQGLVFSALSASNSLGINQIGYAIADGAGGSIQVTNGGNPVSESGAWSAHASVMSPDGGYKVFWENSQTGLRTSWNLDESGDLTSWGFITDADLFQAEKTYDSDLDGDGLTGLQFMPLEPASIGLGSNQLGYAIMTHDGNQVQLTNAGSYVSSNQGDWKASFSIADETGFTAYWENQASSLYTSWDVNTDGSLSSWQFITEDQFNSANIAETLV